MAARQYQLVPAEDRHHLIICVDNSGSMRTQDVKSGSGRTSRAAAVTTLCRQLVMQQLEDGDAASRLRCSYLLFDDMIFDVFSMHSFVWNWFGILRVVARRRRDLFG